MSFQKLVLFAAFISNTPPTTADCPNLSGAYGPCKPASSEITSEVSEYTIVQNTDAKGVTIYAIKQVSVDGSVSMDIVPADDVERMVPLDTNHTKLIKAFCRDQSLVVSEKHIETNGAMIGAILSATKNQAGDLQIVKHDVENNPDGRVLLSCQLKN